MLTQVTRNRFVESALLATRFPAIAPGPYERMILSDFVKGTLTITQAIELLEGHTEGEFLSIVLAEASPFWA